MRYGHVVRMPEGRMPGYLLEWTPKHGRRRRGGTRTSWIDAVMTDVNIFLVMLLSSWLVTESYCYRWYDTVPRMMQETQAAHRCEET